MGPAGRTTTKTTADREGKIQTGGEDPVSELETLTRLLERHPTAAVTGVNGNGLAVPVPDSIRLNGQRVLESRAVPEWVVAEDRAAVARAWFRVRSAGSAEVPVHLVSDPTTSVLLHLINCFDSLGVAIAVIVPAPVVGEEPVGLGPALEARSQFASLGLDHGSNIITCDGPSAAMLGFRPEQLIGTQGLDLIHTDDQAQVIDAWLAAVSTRRPVTARYRHSYGGNGWLWVDGTFHSYLGQADRDDIAVQLFDVSEVMAVNEAMQAQERLLNRIAQALPVGLLQVDRRRNVVYTNDRLHAILRSPARDSLEDLFVTVDDKDRDALDTSLAAVLGPGTDGDLEIGLSWSGGEHRRCLVNFRTLPAQTAAGGGAILCVSDTTDSFRMRVELEDRATFDVLTRCRNRASVMDALEVAVATGRADDTGVIFIDLDRFKSVPDRLGHAVGDELLVAIAGRLRNCLRANDVLGRIGGDEFLVVCPQTRGSESLLVLAQRIRDASHGTIVVAGHPVEISASIGVASGAAGMGADDLVAIADDAMYQSKRKGLGLPVLGTRPEPVLSPLF